jgi:hypothetical protein
MLKTKAFRPAAADIDEHAEESDRIAKQRAVSNAAYRSSDLRCHSSAPALKAGSQPGGIGRLHEAIICSMLSSKGTAYFQAC